MRLTKRQIDKKKKRQRDKETKRQKGKKAKDKNSQRKRPEREFIIVISGQFRTLAVFLILFSYEQCFQNRDSDKDSLIVE